MDSSAPPTEPSDAKASPLATWHPSSIWTSLKLRPRLMAGIATGGSALFLLPGSFSGEVRSALAWCAGGLVYLAGAFHTFAVVDADRLREAADQEDEGRGAILALVLLAIGASYAAIFALQATIKTAGAGKGWLVALAAATIVVSWLVTQVVFTMHYAHDYYRPDTAERDAEGGLKFPDEDKPDYWDFLYFATSLGAASQTSDVSIASRTLRRIVTLHCIVSFFFNTSVLALTINLAASAAGN